MNKLLDELEQAVTDMHAYLSEATLGTEQRDSRRRALDLIATLQTEADDIDYIRVFTEFAKKHKIGFKVTAAGILDYVVYRGDSFPVSKMFGTKAAYEWLVSEYGFWYASYNGE